MYGYLEETLSIDTFFNTVVELNKSKGTSSKGQSFPGKRIQVLFVAVSGCNNCI